MKEIFEEEEFEKESLIKELKEFYLTVFGKDILDPEVHYFHNSNPLQEQILQTEDMLTQSARILSYELLNSTAKLITSYKTQVNLAVHTYDVTLLKDLTKFSSTGNSTYSCRKLDPTDSKEIQAFVKLLKIDVCNATLIYSISVSKTFKSLGESTF